MAEPAHQVDPAMATELLRRRFRVPVWYGQFTGRWWAFVRDPSDGFVEAGTPEELGRLLDGYQTAVVSRQRQLGGSGGPGGGP